MIISITGKPGCGKTTLLKSIVEKLEEKIGFYTVEVRNNKRRIGFKAICSWGKEIWLAKVGESCEFRIGKYCVFVKDFEKEVVEELLIRMKEKNIIYIDEIGKMEFLSERFRKFASNILNMKNKLFLLTLPVKDFHHIVKELRKNSALLIDAGKYWNRKEKAVMKIIRFIENSHLN